MDLYNAVEWALTQIDHDGLEITKNTPHALVEKVRLYLNDNNIEYSTFSYDDLVPLLN